MEIAVLILAAWALFERLKVYTLCHYMMTKNCPAPTQEELRKSILFVLRHLFRR